MKKSDVYKQVDECLLEDMGGDLLLYNPKTATTLHLNGPSSIVWNLCTGENSVAEMIEALQEAYPDQASQIESDVISVIQDFKSNEVLELVTAIDGDSVSFVSEEAG